MRCEYGTQVRYPMEALTRVREDGEVELVWLEGEYPGGWRPWGRPSWSNRPVSDELAQSYYVETECRMNGYAYLKGEHRVVRRPWVEDYEVVPESVMTDGQRAARRAFHGDEDPS